MRISDWSSDVCSSDLDTECCMRGMFERGVVALIGWATCTASKRPGSRLSLRIPLSEFRKFWSPSPSSYSSRRGRPLPLARSEEHTSELQSLMRISYAVFCLKKTNKKRAKDAC